MLALGLFDSRMRVAVRVCPLTTHGLHSMAKLKPWFFSKT